MSAGRSDRHAPPDALFAALEETGPIGSTTRQLSDRLGLREETLAPRLEKLAADGEVLRLGRGLWVLHGYRDLADHEEFLGPAEYVERFVHDGGPAPTTYAGPITFASSASAPVHRWWPYVQGYSAEFVASVLANADTPRPGRVLDPFSGSGTTLVEARRAGWAALGWEVLAPAALAARVKCRFETPPQALLRAATQFERSARRRRRGTLPFLRETRRQFPSATLEELGRLRAALPPDGRAVDEAIRLAFAATLIPVSRLRRSPCLGYAPHRSDPPRSATAEFETRVQAMVADLRELQGLRPRWGPPAQVVQGDARGMSLPEESIDVAVTSPPYVNGMDYVMNYKLDLAWLGYVSGYDGLAALRQASVACDNLPRAEASRFTDRRTAPDPWLPEILASIRTNVARKGSYRRGDAHGIVLRYFVDLLPVLRTIARALKPRGRFVVVVGDSLIAGTYVPGDLLLARLAAREGLRIRSVAIARVRRSGQRRSFQLRESVVTLERPVARSA